MKMCTILLTSFITMSVMIISNSGCCSWPWFSSCGQQLCHCWSQLCPMFIV